MAGGYRLGAGGELPPLLLDDAEAVAVAVGLRTAASGSIAGIEETSVRALAKLEQVLPVASATPGQRAQRRHLGLRRRRSADRRRRAGDDRRRLPGRDPLHFAYIAKDDAATKRNTEPCAVVYSGHRWYLVAFDLDRDDWRTFRIDRIRGRVRLGGRGRRRTVPAATRPPTSSEQLRASGAGEAAAAPGRIRLAGARRPGQPADPGALRDRRARRRDACIVTTRGAWSRSFLVWMALLDEPMEVLDPPEFAEVVIAATVYLWMWRNTKTAKLL